MGVRRKGKSVEMKLLIPEETYFRFERRLTSDFTKKPEYGRRSQIITALILSWLEQHEVKKP
jgi:hypothetical protein